ACPPRRKRACSIRSPPRSVSYASVSLSESGFPSESRFSGVVWHYEVADQTPCATRVILAGNITREAFDSCLLRYAWVNPVVYSRRATGADPCDFATTKIRHWVSFLDCRALANPLRVCVGIASRLDHFAYPSPLCLNGTRRNLDVIVVHGARILV